MFGAKKMPKYCPNCGAKLTEKAKYCPECGNRIETIETVTSEAPTTETQVVEKRGEPENLSTSSKPSDTRSSQKHTSSIMFFVFGVILLIVGVWLFSITSIVPHYETIYGFQVPTGWDTIHPYLGLAGLLAVAGLCIIVVAIINVIVIEKRAETEKSLVRLQFCPNCGRRRVIASILCPFCGFEDFKRTDISETSSLKTSKEPIQT